MLHETKVSKLLRPLLLTVLQATGTALAQNPEPAVLREHANALLGTIEAVPTTDLQAPVVKLGQALFWDQRLSLDGNTACASCHFIENGGADGRSRSPNARGILTTFNAMTVFNAQEAKAGLRWLADRASGAEQALGSITGSMGFAAREDILPVLENYGYRPRFADAFPADSQPLSVANYGIALEAYQRTLRTPAAFDAWIDNVALTMPYYHDGSVPDLIAAIDVMARAQLGRELPAAALGDLSAFLSSLTGEPPANFKPPADIDFKSPAIKTESTVQ